MSLDLMKTELTETDPRFASGPWTGYWTQPPGQKGAMDMLLTFRTGQISGCGRDRVGNFLFKGQYELLDGKCRWVKSYLGKHDVFYDGQAKGKGIVGVWTIGRFAIWPEGEDDPTLAQLMEELDLPLANTLEETPEFNTPLVPVEELVGVGADKDDDEEWRGGEP